MRVLFFILLLIACSATSAQIKGTVTDGLTGNPLPNANIFISGTSKGTVSDADGYFVLQQIPDGKYELVISLIGYQTIVHPFETARLPLTLKVQMEIKIKEEESATVTPFEKNGWQRWGGLFTEMFIGTSANAAQCKIVNCDVISFRYNKKTGMLEAVAGDILIIENEALGYRIKYQLEQFVYNSNSAGVMYAGYPLFEELGRGRAAKYRKNRKKAYYGSMMHLVRSLFGNRLKEDGFNVWRLRNLPNYEKQRVKEIIQRSKNAARLNADSIKKGGAVMINADDIFGGAIPDSVTYYRAVMRQPDFYEIIVSGLLTADSLVMPAGNPRYKIFSFPELLLVEYKNEPIADEYKRQQMFRNMPKYQTTRLFFVNDATQVEIEANGNYYNPVELFTNGYMGWEKTGDLLPLDYEPPLNG